MLSHAKLPKFFWGEAMRIVVDLINLSPLYPLEGDIPEKVWTRKFVSFEHLRVFGFIQMKSLGHNEHREVVQEEQVDTVNRNDESTVDDVEENPTVENDGLE
ncbi:hypothetical protein AAG906_035234 [Vitis piasezkii]